MSNANLLIHPRRRFIQTSAALAATFITPQLVAKPNKETGVRSIAFHNLHTGEKGKLDYWIDGAYEPEALAEIDKLLRDHRSDETCTMDTKLIDSLYSVQCELQCQGKTVEVISGYRSPATNAKLRNNSKGVAKKSYHMQGKAIDVQIPGYSSSKLFSAAKSLKNGGVGYYGDNRFVHLDVGAVRSWGR